MNKVEIRDDQVLAMDEIAPGVHGLRITFVNVFGVVTGDGNWTLVDAAIPFSAGIIQRWAEETMGGPPKAILLMENRLPLNGILTADFPVRDASKTHGNEKHNKSEKRCDWAIIL